MRLVSANNAAKFAAILTKSRFVVPAQPVDATPSNSLIQRSFADRTHLFDRTRSNPTQDSVPADLTLAGDFVFVFNASRVRPKCCVDPLNPPA
jgi:hypothetical protein